MKDHPDLQPAPEAKAPPDQRDQDAEREKEDGIAPGVPYAERSRGRTPGQVAEEQVSDARLGRRSIPAAGSADRRELWLGVSVAEARPER